MGQTHADEWICIAELQAWAGPATLAAGLPVDRLGRGGSYCSHPDPVGPDAGGYCRAGLGRAGVREEWPDRLYEAGGIVAGNQVTRAGNLYSSGIRNAPNHLSD